jgi:RNA polymerase-binding protein DksA
LLKTQALAEPRPESKAEADKLPRTRLNAKQLQEFKELLLRKRAELVGDVERLTDEALNRKRDGGFGEHSAMPIHMAEAGTDNWEQEFTLGLIENERAQLREVDEALERIENGTYGICLATHKPISVARLRAKPWARYCIDYARLRDEGRVP